MTLKLIMLPGLDGTGELFKQFSQHLPSSLVPIIATYPSDASLGYDELLKIAESLIPNDEPYIILGESFSGPIAIRLASRQAKFMKGLVLVNTFLQCPRPMLARALPLIPDVILSKPPDFLLNFILRNSETESTASKGVKAVINQLDVSLVRSRLESIRDIDVSREASLVKVPVCVVNSSDDSFIPKREAQKLGSVFVVCEKVNLPGDHFLLQAFPRQSAVEVARFCSNVISISQDEA